MVDQSYSLLNYWYVKIKGTTYLKTKHHFNYTTVCRLLKIGGRVTKHAHKVILTLDSRIQEQFDGLFWRAWERLNALWQ